MTYLFDETDTQASDEQLLVPGGFNPADGSLIDRLARAEEARADERSKRLTAEATVAQMAELIAQEHRHVVEHREARERAERTAKEMAELVKLQSERADRAEEASRQALTAYLDDPFRPFAPPPSLREKLVAKLRPAR
jgi:hypothetical protein